MSVIVKNLTNGTRTAVYQNKKGVTKYVALEPGRNQISDELWASIKDSDFIKRKLKYDQLTVSEHKEEEEKLVEVAPLDLEKLESLVGQEDAKELIQEYADDWGIELSKRKTSANMIEDFKAEHAKL